MSKPAISSGGAGAIWPRDRSFCEKGKQIRAATIALLASQGFAEVTTGGEPTAGVISTGDELVHPGEKIAPGEIYDSNSALLNALLQRCCASAKSVEHCRDNRESLTEAIKRGIKNQVLIISGGVSVGEHDLVKEALRQFEAEIEIWRVAIKPGKPFLFGNIDRCLIFGLPGNPVSAFVTFLQFVRPAILKMMGAADLDLPQSACELDCRFNERRRAAALHPRQIGKSEGLLRLAARNRMRFSV